MASNRARRKPPSPEQKVRYALRQRLRSCAEQIGRLVDEVEIKHSDRSGAYRAGWLAPPVDNSDLKGGGPYRPKLLDQWERITQEAETGCVESAAFVERYGAMLHLALELRQERPPKRDPSFHPSALLTATQRAWIEGRESRDPPQTMLPQVLQSPVLRG